jgi:hypothetical protein
MNYTRGLSAGAVKKKVIVPVNLRQIEKAVYEVRTGR